MTNSRLTQGEKAKRIDTTPRRFRQLIAEGIFSDNDPIDRVVVKFIRHLRAKAILRTSKGSPLEDARNESLRIDIHRKRLELAELEGKLGRIEVWEEELAAVFANVRTKLLTLPGKCAALVEPDSAAIVQDTVQREIHAVLRDIARNSVPADPGESARTKT